jgi:succinoglycan biosynthesis transport protein ExoP
MIDAAENHPPFAPRGTNRVAATQEAALLPLRRWFFALRERWLSALLLVTALCVPVGWALSRQPTVYATRATLLIERSNDRVVDIKQVVDTTVDSSLSDALLLTHIEQLRSHTFLAQVVHSLTPAERKIVLAPYADDAAGKHTGAGAAAGGEPADEDARLLEILSRGLRVERAPRTMLMVITVRHRDAAAAQLLANRLGDHYIQYLIDRSTASNDSALVFLNQQAEVLRKKVEDTEHTVQAYRERNNLIFIEQNQNIVVERVRALSAALTQVRVTRLGLDVRFAQTGEAMHDSDAPRELVSLPEFTGFAGVQRELDDQRGRREVLALRYRPLHPAMKANASMIATLERQRHDQLASALTDVRNQRDKAVQHEKLLAGELAVAERESLRLDQLTVNYNVLQREVATTRETYAQILSRLNETTISSRLQNTNIKFFDRAGLPNRPVEPSTLNIIGILAALGGLVIVGYPLAADMLDDRLRTSADVETFVGADLAGLISEAKKIPADARAWIIQRALDEDTVESFRGLYSHIQFSARAGACRTILVTSTVPGEGKSFVACNLGASFAAHGHRTLLIDADFRRPTLHVALFLDNRSGLLPWLQAQRPDGGDDYQSPLLGIVELSTDLSVLRSGGESRKVTELLGRPRMAALMADLQKRYEVIIIDTSPAGVFPDADSCVRFCQELLYVCRFKTPQRTHVRETVQRLRQRSLHFLGVVLNGVPHGSAGEYYLAGRGRGRRHYGDYHRDDA